MRNPIPIVYRDFHDVPRAFVVEWNGTRYLFDCRFDDAADDCADCCVIDARPDVTDAELAGPWAMRPGRGVQLPQCVPVGSLVFDSTKRLTREGDVLASVHSGPTP